MVLMLTKIFLTLIQNHNVRELAARIGTVLVYLAATKGLRHRFVLSIQSNNSLFLARSDKIAQEARRFCWFHSANVKTYNKVKHLR